MALRLEIISRHRQSLGERGIKEFGVGGGVIGRSLECDWVLPDGQRYLSSRHASIDFRSGSYYLVDISTNGVYVNGAAEPVGRGKPQRLFDGDRLQIGDYQMRVAIDEVDDPNEQLSDASHVDPVDKAQHVEPPDPTTHDLVDAYEITGVGIEELLSEEAEAAAFKKAAEARAAGLQLEDARSPAPASTPSKRVSASSAKQQVSAAQASAATPAQPAAHAPLPGKGIDAFFRGAGMRPVALEEKQAELLLHRLGQIMRELIVGITENLHLRAEQKNTMRLPHTTIQPRNNNPLKLSAGVEEALNNLLLRQMPEYLSAVDSVRDAFRDIRTHQQAMLDATVVAVIDYVERLDPHELEQKFAKGPKRNALIGAANKLRYWDQYKDIYQVMTQHAPGHFPQLFIEELSRAYEQELARTNGAGVQPRKARAG